LYVMLPVVVVIWWWWTTSQVDRWCVWDREDTVMVVMDPDFTAPP